MRYKKTKRNGKTVYVHRTMMEDRLGRKLPWSKVVHHKNDDKTDNRIENFEVMGRKRHARHHMAIHPIRKRCQACRRMFSPQPSHRSRDVTCGGRCRDLAIQASRLPIGIDVGSVFDWCDNPFMSLRSIGRMFGVTHHTVKRIGSLPEEDLRRLVRLVRMRA